MALDFHLTKDDGEPLYNGIDAALEGLLHEIIFYRVGLPKGKFPLFRRMADYYKDARYGFEELEKLISEIKEIQQLFSKNKEISEQLNSILVTCKKAHDEKMNIGVYCD